MNRAGMGGPGQGQVANSQSALLQTSFKNANWPPNFITPENVLEYFCNQANMFYEMSSCNQNIKMQNIARPLEECLLDMTGIQYVLWSAQPPLYIICKHRRNSKHNVTPMAYYYIINGTVYQCPDLHTFVQSRLLGAVEPLKKAFDQIVSVSRYNVAKGYYWEFKDKPAAPSAKADKEEEKPMQARSSHFQQTRTNMLMQNLLEQFPASDGLEILPQEPESKMSVDDVEETESVSSAPITVAPMDPPIKKPKVEVR